MMKILVGAIVQESNTFSPIRSDMSFFHNHVFLLGEELDKLKIENEVLGFRKAVEEEGVTVIPSLCLYAVSSGVFAKESFAELKRLLGDRLRAAPACDAVYFALHGAMVAEECDDVEGELAAMIREQAGEIPFVVSLDLHANVTRRLVGAVDGVVGYRTYPHTDFVETGCRAARLLLHIARCGTRPVVALRKLPMIVPAENSQTSHGPFADLWAEAEKGEQEGASIVTSLFPVQPWLDIEEMGSSVVVVGSDRGRVEREADRLAELFWAARRRFDIRLYGLDEAIDLALANNPDSGPVVLSDSADSPGAGSTGDSPAVLRRILERRVETRLTCLLVITDAPAVRAAVEAGVGRTVELTVGHTVNPDGEPLAVCGLVRRIGDGRFRLNGGHARNTIADMGRCVVLEIGGVSLLIGERPVFTGDPEMYRSMGLEPRAADLIQVKSANQFRADYEAIASSIYILDTPGSSSANLRSLVFRKLPTPFYPFDDGFERQADSGSELSG